MYNLKILYLNLSFYFLFVATTIMVLPFLALFYFFSSVSFLKRHLLRLFRRSISYYGRLVISFPFPLIKVHYSDYTKNDGDGPYIFVCNHKSASDPFLMSYLPYEAVQVVDTWPFRIPILGQTARMAEYLDVKSIPYDTFLEKSLKLLKDGVSIIFFPEGTRSTNKVMNNFHSAAFRLSIQSKIPIIPICISGNERIPAKGSLLLRPGKIKVSILPAIHSKDIKESNVFVFKNEVRRIIQEKLIDMDCQD
jgi:1-acyl-sn-glycerol-3-phosphate acyltransferase